MAPFPPAPPAPSAAVPHSNRLGRREPVVLTVAALGLDCLFFETIAAMDPFVNPATRGPIFCDEETKIS
jgi:hypothetical protein